ncbi:alpha-amylase family glycosyl hydrolase [Haladaptatus sp. CMAA 1911]|uniref:alpha-amylase family glycosyl hydrolase n=1 Tax=unclassified Haladaptatus TaxID=2622732 RepID=UPI00375532E5
MHHPGPPRFVTVDEPTLLAPRNPDPDGEFVWTIAESPDESEASVSETPIVEFTADTAGKYRLELSAPDGMHSLTIRAFPDNRNPVTIELPTDKRPLSNADIPRILMSLDGNTDIRDYTTFSSPGRPRVSLDTTIEGDEVVIAATARSAPDSTYADDELQIEFYLDDRDTLRNDFNGNGSAVRFSRKDIEGTVRIHAVAVGERHSVADVVRLQSGDGAVHVERPNDPPEWARGATVYEICPRQFAGDPTDSKHATDGYTATFVDLKKRVPYLESLGIDCVWVMPILDTRTSHGYQVTDYFTPAADLGTRAEYESFVDRCHEAGIKVMFDLVINHSGFDHPKFQMSAAEVDEYRDWYTWDDDTYEYYFNWTHLPNFNYRNLAVRRHLLSVVDEWAGLIDGFRCDVAFGTPHGFWKEVRDRIKAEHPDFLLLDETLPRDASYHEGEFDMHHDTTLYRTLCDIGEGREPAAAILDASEAHEREGFPESVLHFRYVENHDMPRYLNEYGRAPLQGAVAAIFTLPGVPMIYYGQERGIDESGWPQSPMPWHDGDNELTRFHRQLIAARSENRALRRGSLERIVWSSESAEVVAFAREDGDDRVIVAVNFGDTPATVSVDEDIDATDLVADEEIDVRRKGDRTEFAVDRVVVLSDSGN